MSGTGPSGGYALGVDLGTTFTAAALVRARTPDRAESIPLGSRSTAVPSVAHVDAGHISIGEPAARRAITEPWRVAREFKRRFGDDTPLLLDGRPVEAHVLTAHLLSWTLNQVVTTEGRPPDSLVVTHPANWGSYKLDLLRQILDRTGIRPAAPVAEPVAAATYYARQRDLPPGAAIAVYDLGGGTFDTAVVRADPDGFRIVGRPDGIERLGGIDFDHALLRHLTAAIGRDPDGLDTGDPALTTAFAQLREACVRAKETLSVESEVTIPVMLPDLHTRHRLTRTELEAMVRPALDETLVSLRRTIGSAGMAPDEIHAVLLIGGSSRIPLVGRLIAAELGRPVVSDARPKDTIPLGAALLAAREVGPTPAPIASPVPVSPDPSRPTPPPPPTGPPEVSGRRSLLVPVGAAMLVLAVVAALLVPVGDGGDGPDLAAEPVAARGTCPAGAQPIGTEMANEARIVVLECGYTAMPHPRSEGQFQGTFGFVVVSPWEGGFADIRYTVTFHDAEGRELTSTTGTLPYLAPGERAAVGGVAPAAMDEPPVDITIEASIPAQCAYVPEDDVFAARCYPPEGAFTVTDVTAVVGEDDLTTTYDVRSDYADHQAAVAFAVYRGADGAIVGGHEGPVNLGLQSGPVSGQEIGGVAIPDIDPEQTEVFVGWSEP